MEDLGLVDGTPVPKHAGDGAGTVDEPHVPLAPVRERQEAGDRSSSTGRQHTSAVQVRATLGGEQLGYLVRTGEMRRGRGEEGLSLTCRPAAVASPGP